ncbi:uncharacterized protein DS421_15g518020 [Arachis hypogaea]|nr:uncharacterized protein DS421_15g518020 [Arachis hypogaea]
MVSNILYRNPVQVFGGLIQFQIMPITDDASMQQMFCIYQQTRFHVPMIELYVEFEQHSSLDVAGEEVDVDECGDLDWEEDNNDSEEEFEANYEVDDKNDDGDLAGNPVMQNEAASIVSRHPFGVPSFMRTLDLEAMHAPEFPEYANKGKGNVAAEDGEFSVGMEFGSRESVISAIKSYTISRGVDYTVYESESQTFYAKCKGYGAGCDWLIRASLIRKKACWEIRRYNDKHTCTMGTISQDHAKLDSNTIADAIRPLVQADPSIKVKSIIAEVQSRFNYTVSYRKTCNDCKDADVSCPDKDAPRLPSLPTLQATGAVEGETADAWEFFLTNLRRYVVTIDGVGIIFDRHNSTDAAIARSNGAWSPPRAWHMFCIRHIESNFLRRIFEDGIGVQQELSKASRAGLRRTCNSVMRSGARNLPVTAIVRSTFYRLNELFTRKSAEAHERVRNGFTYSEFATKRVEESFRRAGSIVVNQFDRRNEVFEVREMPDGSIYTVNLAQRHCDCGHFQVERLPCRHVLACCANQRLDWQVYVHDVYKMSEICKVYRGEFVPMCDPSTWAPYEGAKVIAN